MNDDRNNKLGFDVDSSIKSESNERAWNSKKASENENHYLNLTEENCQLITLEETSTSYGQK